MIFRREQTFNLTNAEIIEKVQKEIIDSKMPHISVLVICPNVYDTKELWYKVAKEKHNIHDFRPKGLTEPVEVECSGICELFGDTKVTVSFRHADTIYTPIDDFALNDYTLKLCYEEK